MIRFSKRLWYDAVRDQNHDLPLMGQRLYHQDTAAENNNITIASFPFDKVSRIKFAAQRNSNIYATLEKIKCFTSMVLFISFRNC